MKVVLVNPPTSDTHLFRSAPPLGLAYIAGCARKAGYDVSIYDAYFDTPTDTLTVISGILARNGDVVGFSLSADSVGVTLEVANALKAHDPRITIVVGGHQASATHKALLEAESVIDVVVRGEGERTFVELLDAIGNECRLRTVDGISYRSGSDVVVNPPRRLMNQKELDALPLPAWDLLPSPARYTQRMGQSRICTRVVSSRGCVHSCRFCSISSFYGQSGGGRWRSRGVQGILAEIDQLVSRFGVQRISFNDDSFLVDLERVRALVEGLLVRRYPIEFVLLATARDVLRAESLLPLLKESGCCGIEIGIESGTDFILNALGKPSTVSENSKAIRAVQATGLPVLPDFIMFHPLSTVDSLKRNVQFLKEHKLWGRAKHDVLWNRLAIYPGTPLFAEMVAKGRVSPSFVGGEVPWRHEDAEVEEIASLIVHVTRRLLWPLHRFIVAGQWIVDRASGAPSVSPDQTTMRRICADARMDLIEVCRIPYDIFEHVLAPGRQLSSVDQLMDKALSGIARAQSKLIVLSQTLTEILDIGMGPI